MKVKYNLPPSLKILWISFNNDMIHLKLFILIYTIIIPQEFTLIQRVNGFIIKFQHSLIFHSYSAEEKLC